MQQAIGMRSGYNIIILLLYNIISETQTVPQTILTSKFRKREKLYVFITPFLIIIALT